MIYFSTSLQGNNKDHFPDHFTENKAQYVVDFNITQIYVISFYNIHTDKERKQNK